MKHTTGRYNYLLTGFMVVSNVFVINGVFYLLTLIFRGIDVSNSYYQSLLIFINLGYFLALTTSRLVNNPKQLAWQHVIVRSAYFVGISMLISTLCLVFAKISYEISREFLVWYFPATFLSMSVFCLTGRRMMPGILKSGVKRENVVILGASTLGQELHDELQTNSYLGVNVLGFFDDNPLANQGNLLGKITDVKNFALTNHISKIYCTLPASAKEKMKDILSFCEDNVISFHVVPAMWHYVDTAVILETAGNVPLLSLRKIALSNPINAALKRSFDFFASGIFLLLFFPIVYIIVGLAIKISSPGPVFFMQKRTGKGGRDFNCIKFRSMRVNASADKLQATVDDPRKTKVGNFLRRTNIDELPQFINVFKGDMSIVGPRPHMLSHTSKYSQVVEKYMVRHFIKPGITGLAQISGFRGETKEIHQMEGRIKKDIWYLENWSVWLDLDIMLKTAFMTIKGDKQAY